MTVALDRYVSRRAFLISSAAGALALGVLNAGRSQFQTNSLIAAAAGSFAGTVARKLAQERFLSSLGRDLGR
jgi:uncharacterized membrane protein YjjB (DUF3815 family)